MWKRLLGTFGEARPREPRAGGNEQPDPIGELMEFLQAAKWMRLSLPNMAEVVAPLRGLMETRLSGTSRTKRVASRRAIVGDG